MQSEIYKRDRREHLSMIRLLRQYDCPAVWLDRERILLAATRWLEYDQSKMPLAIYMWEAQYDKHGPLVERGIFC